MAVSTPALSTESRPTEHKWLHSRDWDLIFISLSVVLVAMPYLIYIGLLQLNQLVQPLATALNADVDSVSRNLVNGFVALVVGGPHMYATFTRTSLSKEFREKYPFFVWSSLIIPMIVITIAFLNLPLLLTIFFFWASIHVLHQIIYITELYNHKKAEELPKFFQYADYGVILTSLYPLAAVKMLEGTFAIGPNNIGEVVAGILTSIGIPWGAWIVWVSGGLFAFALTVWIIKTIIEWQRGTLNWPKTLFLGLTVTASFFVPALGNLDTAFQGMNMWHSLQYLAITWMLNHHLHKQGKLDHTPFVDRLSGDGSARKFYRFNMTLALADIGLAGLIFAGLYFGLGKSFDFSFDRSYYIAILSFLWMHYYHDHFLFTQPDVIEV